MAGFATDATLDVPPIVRGQFANHAQFIRIAAASRPCSVRGALPPLHFAEHKVIPQVVHDLAMGCNLDRASGRATLPATLRLNFRVEETDFLRAVNSRPLARTFGEDAELQGLGD